jgi:hypothetical protein
VTSSGPRGEVITENNTASFRFLDCAVRGVLASGSRSRRAIEIDAQRPIERVSSAETSRTSARAISAREILSSPEQLIFRFLLPANWI